MLRNKVFYKHRPIATVEALARALGVSVTELKSTSARADNFYRLAKVIKKEGKRDRFVYKALEPLRSIQDRINKILLRQVEYPCYLTGGLPDPQKTRGYIRSAEMHADSAVLISEDVSDFFPSVAERQISEIFRKVFRFPPPVAMLLAALCVRKGRLVQGAAPSTYIANLAFFRNEPAIFEYASNHGMKYDRFIDDLTLSSKSPLSAKEVTRAVTLLRQVIELEGFRVNRKKQLVARRGRHREVHNLNVDGARATIPQRERKRIRAAVHNLENAFHDRSTDVLLAKEFQRVRGRVIRLAALHPREGFALKSRLMKVRKYLTN